MTPEVSQVHLHETGAGQECLTSGFILMSRGLSGGGAWDTGQVCAFGGGGKAGAAGQVC